MSLIMDPDFETTFSSVAKKTCQITTTVHVTLLFDEFLFCFTNQLVQMSLSFCRHWSWIQTLKRPPCTIRGHVFFCQGRRPQGWWRYPAPGAHSLCCPRKTKCCWNRDFVVPRRHFEGLKNPKKNRLKDSWIRLILQQFDKFWKWGALNDRKRKLRESAKRRHFEGLNEAIYNELIACFQES